MDSTRPTSLLDCNFGRLHGGSKRLPNSCFRFEYDVCNVDCSGGSSSTVGTRGGGSNLLPILLLVLSSSAELRYETFEGFGDNRLVSDSCLYGQCGLVQFIPCLHGIVALRSKASRCCCGGEGSCLYGQDPFRHLIPNRQGISDRRSWEDDDELDRLGSEDGYREEL